jgi:hypothetical protein
LPPLSEQVPELQRVRERVLPRVPEPVPVLRRVLEPVPLPELALVQQLPAVSLPGIYQPCRPHNRRKQKPGTAITMRCSELSFS